MPLLNYTTKIEAAQTAAEILGILAKLKAKGASIDYDANGVPSALEFVIPTDVGDMRFRMPARVDGVHKILEADWGEGRIDLRYASKAQATRVAWRILKTWVEAQVAIIEVGMVKAEEVMLPYAVTGEGVTFFESFVSSQKALPRGRK